MTLQSRTILWGTQHSGHHQDEPESQQNEFSSRGMLPSLYGGEANVATALPL
jgi:hypothetical protein